MLEDIDTPEEVEGVLLWVGRVDVVSSCAGLDGLVNMNRASTSTLRLDERFRLFLGLNTAFVGLLDESDTSFRICINKERSELDDRGARLGRGVGGLLSSKDVPLACFFGMTGTLAVLGRGLNSPDSDAFNAFNEESL